MASEIAFGVAGGIVMATGFLAICCVWGYLFYLEQKQDAITKRPR